jgi:hypothetical protein
LTQRFLFLFVGVYVNPCFNLAIVCVLSMYDLVCVF